MRLTSAADPATPAKFSGTGNCGIGGLGGADCCDQLLVAPSAAAVSNAASDIALIDFETAISLSPTWIYGIAGTAILKASAVPRHIYEAGWPDKINTPCLQNRVWRRPRFQTSNSSWRGSNTGSHY